MHGHPNPFQSPPSNPNLSSLANPPFLQYYPTHFIPIIFPISTWPCMATQTLFKAINPHHPVITRSPHHIHPLSSSHIPYIPPSFIPSNPTLKPVIHQTFQPPPHGNLGLPVLSKPTPYPSFVPTKPITTPPSAYESMTSSQPSSTSLQHHTHPIPI